MRSTMPSSWMAVVARCYAGTLPSVQMNLTSFSFWEKTGSFSSSCSARHHVARLSSKQLEYASLTSCSGAMLYSYLRLRGKGASDLVSCGRLLGCRCRSVRPATRIPDRSTRSFRHKPPVLCLDEEPWDGLPRYRHQVSKPITRATL